MGWLKTPLNSYFVSQAMITSYCKAEIWGFADTVFTQFPTLNFSITVDSLGQTPYSMHNTYIHNPIYALAFDKSISHLLFWQLDLWEAYFFFLSLKIFKSKSTIPGDLALKASRCCVTAAPGSPHHLPVQQINGNKSRYITKLFNFFATLSLWGLVLFLK